MWFRFSGGFTSLFVVAKWVLLCGVSLGEWYFWSLIALRCFGVI